MLWINACVENSIVFDFLVLNHFYTQYNNNNNSTTGDSKPYFANNLADMYASQMPT